MLCSADELGLSDRNYQEEDGILILNRFIDNLELGKNLEEVLGLEEDIVLNVAPTANRGDQMSIIGVARELCAIFDRHLKYSPLEATVEYGNDNFEVEIKDTDVCKYYSVGLLSNVNIKNLQIGCKKTCCIRHESHQQCCRYYKLRAFRTWNTSTRI